MRLPKGTSALPIERDAWAFLDAAGITSALQQRAVVQLVRDLKKAQLWTKMEAVYPFVGGTATTHKWNLKNPSDTNDAYRLTFSGGLTHNSNGITGNGTNGYINTNYNASNSSASSWHRMVYSRNAAGIAGIEIGSVHGNSATNTFRATSIACRFSDGTAYFANGAYNPNDTSSYVNSDGSGLYISSRTATDAFAAYRNATSVATTTQTGQSFETRPEYALARNNDSQNRPAFYSSRNIAFVSLGSGLTAFDVSLYVDVVNRYQKTLGRAV